MTLYYYESMVQYIQYTLGSVYFAENEFYNIDGMLEDRIFKKFDVSCNLSHVFIRNGRFNCGLQEMF